MQLQMASYFIIESITYFMQPFEIFRFQNLHFDFYSKLTIAEILQHFIAQQKIFEKTQICNARSTEDALQTKSLKNFD